MLENPTHGTNISVFWGFLLPMFMGTFFTPPKGTSFLAEPALACAGPWATPSLPFFFPPLPLPLLPLPSPLSPLEVGLP